MKDRPLKILMAVFILVSLLSVGPVMAQPDPPTNLQAVSLANGGIDLSWTAVPGATSYEVFKSTIDSIPSSSVTVSDTSMSLIIGGGDGLVDGTIWFFWVKAVDGSGTSDPAGSASAVCDASPPYAVTPSSPLNGSYVLTNTPTLTWSATTDDNSAGSGETTGVDHYELQYSTTPGFTPSTTMTVSNISGTDHTPSALPNGTYYWRVRAFDVAGNALDWTSVSINVYTFIVNMDAPSLVSPSDGSAFNNDPPGELPPTFQWTEVSGANGYLLEIDVQTPITASPAYSFNVSGGSTTSYTPIAIFGDDTYYWRVSATNGGGTTIGIYSNVWSFSVDQTAPDVPTLSSPANASTVSSDTPALDWGSVSDAAGYDLEISSNNTTDLDGSFSTVEYSSTGLTTDSHTPTTQLSDAAHYWHVRSYDSAGNYSDWSPTWTFTVDTSLPQAPTLTSPSDGGTITTGTPTFSWSAVTGAASYNLEVSTSETFTGTLTLDQTVTGATSYTPSSALSNDTYYWRVSSNLAPTQFSSVWSFTVNVTPSEQPVSIQVEVRSGATGEKLNNAQVTIMSGPTTIDSDTTGANGRVSLSAPPGSYTLRVLKNLWDEGDGDQYSRQISISTSGEIFYANLYTTGRDLLVASVRYNDKTGSTPPSIVIYRDGAVYSTVSMPNLPTSDMMPNNLVLAKTNLVIEVPTTGSYEIADPSYTEGKVSITNLSQNLSNAYVNTVSIQITSSINGVIVDEAGDILTGASVMLLRQSDNAIMGAVETSSIGFLFNLIVPGSYYIRAQKNGYDTVTTGSFEVAPHETTNVGMVTLTQEKGTLNVTIQDTGGQLLDDVTVEIQNSSGQVVNTQIATQGIIGFELPGGTFTLSATKTGYVLEDTASAVIVAGETTSKTLIMTEETTPPPEKGSIQISVTDAAGNPIQLVNVYLDNEKVGVTNQDGILLLEDLDPATYEITLKKDGFDDVSFSKSVTAGEVATHSDSMDEVVVTEDSSRMRWILIAVGAVIVFAIVLLYLTKGRGKEEEMPEEGPRPFTKPEVTPETVARERVQRKAPPTTYPGVTRSGIPNRSEKEARNTESDKRGGGIPTRSTK